MLVVNNDIDKLKDVFETKEQVVADRWRETD